MSVIQQIDEEGNERRNELKIFGKNVAEIKCFKNSFILGICGGVTAGLVCFFATSKPKISGYVASVSLWICVLGYWFPCRYEYEKKFFTYYKLKEEANKAKLNLNSEEISTKQ